MSDWTDELQERIAELEASRRKDVERAGRFLARAEKAEAEVERLTQAEEFWHNVALRYSLTFGATLLDKLIKEGDGRESGNRSSEGEQPVHEPRESRNTGPSAAANPAARKEAGP